MKKFPKIFKSPSGVPSTLDESRLLIQFKHPTTVDKVVAIAKDLRLKLETLERIKNKSGGVQINNAENRYWLRSIDNSPITDEELTNIENKLSDKVSWIGAVYYYGDDIGETNYFSPLPTVILVRKNLTEKLGNQIGDLHLKINQAKSRFLNDYDYFELPDVKKMNSYDVERRLSVPQGDLAFENMPMVRDWCLIPNDTLFAQQWNMTQIQAPQAWDISSGANAIIAAVLDSGVDLTHPDLQLANNGIDLGDMVSDGSPNDFGALTGHGTCCAGIVAATFNNGTGVTGLAGNCRILPLAISAFTDVEIANGINWSVMQGASAISMSFSVGQSMIIETALANAFAANVVLCAATGNSNANGIAFPARNANVMAIGASDQIDARKSPASPDGEGWGSNFGNEMSVVAPGVLIPSTDIQGAGGFNPTAGNAGDYFLSFNGTSSATPHVAGLAALVKSQYSTATSTQIRNVIERTAQKSGPIVYAETVGKPNGTWNQEMGYGRINAFRALDFANTMIKDWVGDDGVEASTPPGGNFWDFSDIVTRATDDNVFNPSNPSDSKKVEKGQTNYIYVRVTNLGPRDARNVNVNIRITPYVGLQFVYPNDWTLVDAMHVSPASVTNNFGTVAAGATVIAKFTISAAQVDELYGWENNNPWHPCLLAQVTADNDYAYSTADLSFGNIVLRKNDFAQRNLTVVDEFLSAGFSFPFVAGSRYSKAKSIRINIDRSKLPKGTKLTLNPAYDVKAFPQVDFSLRHSEKHDDYVILDKTRVKTKVGDCDAIITFGKGSSIELLSCDSDRLKVRNIKGGTVNIENDQQLIDITMDKAAVDFEAQQGEIYPMALHVKFPAGVNKKEAHSVSVYQTDENNHVLGGASFIYDPK